MIDPNTYLSPVTPKQHCNLQAADLRVTPTHSLPVTPTHSLPATPIHTSPVTPTHTLLAYDPKTTLQSAYYRPQQIPWVRGLTWAASSFSRLRARAEESILACSRSNAARSCSYCCWYVRSCISYSSSCRSCVQWFMCLWVCACLCVHVCLVASVKEAQSLCWYTCHNRASFFAKCTLHACMPTWTQKLGSLHVSYLCAQTHTHTHTHTQMLPHLACQLCWYRSQLGLELLHPAAFLRARFCRFCNHCVMSCNIYIIYFVLRHEYIIHYIGGSDSNFNTIERN